MPDTRARLISWTVELKPVARRRSLNSDVIELEEPPDGAEARCALDEDVELEEAVVESKSRFRFP